MQNTSKSIRRFPADTAAIISQPSVTILSVFAASFKIIGDQQCTLPMMTGSKRDLDHDLIKDVQLVGMMQN